MPKDDANSKIDARHKIARQVRQDAADLSLGTGGAAHQANGDQDSPYIFNFTKGLLHDDDGLLANPADFDTFAAGAGDPDPTTFQAAPLNTDPSVFHGATQAQFDALGVPPYREWESPTAGLAFVLEGPDPQAITMPPAPAAGSAELAAEMAEVYQMALCRDWPIAAFMGDTLGFGLQTAGGGALGADARSCMKGAHHKVKAAAHRLAEMQWFKGQKNNLDTDDAEHHRRRRFGDKPTASSLFRGIGEDPWDTPFVSQFMVMGDGGRARDVGARSGGIIRYGAQRIDQKVRVTTPGRDYMTTWRDWLDVQNGLNARPLEQNEFVTRNGGAVAYRTMSSLRDLATYVHDDQLYQAYLNAALIMLQEGYPFDPGIPYHGQTMDTGLTRWNREPFALFGGPHLLTLVTEVSSRALKAVRYQKFSLHRRMRPEQAGALFHTIYSGYTPNREHGGGTFPETGTSPGALARKQLSETLAGYTFPAGQGSEPPLEDILTDIRLHNAAQNGEDPNQPGIAKWLLPMAFPEGSPMHPAYGAGHATVAGACVTLLKAFFNTRDAGDESRPAYVVKPGTHALVPGCPADQGAGDPGLLRVAIAKGLTLEGELNKLMWNISNARNIAGVHYYTDYVESALLGEAITIGILREQMLCYDRREDVSLTVPLLVKRRLPETLLREGGPIGPDDEVEAVRITATGDLLPVPALPRH